MRTAQAMLDRDYAIEEADSYADALEAWAAASTLPWAGLEAASARAGADAVLARYNAEETLVTEEAEADETCAGSQAQAAAVRSGELAGAESEREASRSDAAVTLATANRDATSQQGTSNAAPAAAPKPLEPAALPQPETSRAGEDDFTTNRQSDKDGTRLVDFDATPPVRDVDEGGTVKDVIEKATSAERQNESVVGDQHGGSVLVGDPAEDRQRQLAGEWAEGMMESTPADQWDEAAEAFIANAGLGEAVAEDLRKLVAERQGWEAQREEWRDAIKYAADQIAQERESGGDAWSPSLDEIKLALLPLSMLPIAGPLADVASAGINASQGKWGEMGLDLIGIVPIVGDGIKAAGMAASLGGGAVAMAKFLDKADDAGDLARAGDRVADVSKAADNVADGAKGLSAPSTDAVDRAARNTATPSPAIEGSPYHPDLVNRRVRPEYRTNHAHAPAGPGVNRAKTPEPLDAAEVYNRAVRLNAKTWLSVGPDGKVYRFFADNVGGVHLAGYVDPNDLSRDMRRLLGLR